MLTTLLVAAPVAYADKEVGMKTFKGEDGPAIEAYYVAETQDEWERLWAIIGKEPKGTLEKGKQTGVGIFLGTRPKGDKLDSRKAQNDDGDLEVKLKLKKSKDSSSGETVNAWMIALINDTGDKVKVDLRIKGEEVP